MRLFVAVDLDDAARSAIVAEQHRVAAALRDAPSRIRWVKPEQLHITLVFLGEVSDAHAPSVFEVLGRPVGAPPFQMTLQGLGVFPGRGAPRALWIGVSGGAPELIALQRELSTRVDGLGIATESRPFSPHLTLGRWRESRSVDRRRALDSATPDAIARVDVTGATLYQSRLSSTGPTYTALARATLAGRWPS